MLRVRLLIALVAAVLACGVAQAQDMPPPSQCLAVAQSLPRATLVSLRSAAAEQGEVTITYAGHSTYVIETPGRVTIATDFSGAQP